MKSESKKKKTEKRKKRERLKKIFFEFEGSLSKPNKLTSIMIMMMVNTKE